MKYFVLVDRRSSAPLSFPLAAKLLWEPSVQDQENEVIDNKAIIHSNPYYELMLLKLAIQNHYLRR